MVTSKKVTTPGTEAPTKRSAAKTTPVNPVVTKAPADKVAPTKAVAAKRKPAVKPVPVEAVLAVAPKKQAAAKKAVAPKKVAPPTKPAISGEQRKNYVEVAAFYIAQRRGFAATNPADDWAAAEAEIDRLIASGHFAG
jgi:hypothetical protein